MKNKLIISILISLCSCQSARLPSSFSQLEANVGNDIYWKVNDFYSDYLRYPRSVDELLDYLWYIVNGANDFKYISFEQYLGDFNRILMKEVDTIFFLETNKSKIKIKVTGDKFEIIYKSKVIELERNICAEIKNIFGNSSLLSQMNTCRIFGSDGKLVQRDYVDEFLNLLDTIRKKYLYIFANEQYSNTYEMFRYSRKEGIRAICFVDDVGLNQNLYLKELEIALDAFTVNRNIDSMTFLIKVPVEKLIESIFLFTDRKSTRLNSSHTALSRMASSA